jgi:gamma-glutamyl-gamma-aminobutyrate hydrolase PuuD
VKIVAVSQRVDYFPERNERRDALDQRLITFLMVAGFIPVPVPNVLIDKNPKLVEYSFEVLESWLNAVKPEAIVLSGGNDVGDCPDRDATEIELINYALRNKLPLLGICRGMQIIGLWAGGALHKVQGHNQAIHKLRGIMQTTVNSFHNYSLAYCPDGFEVIARSEDGEIESIRHLTLPWEGWMWHPERETLFSDEDCRRIKDLIGS